MSPIPLDHGQHLRETMAAVRLSIKWFGTRRRVSPSQKTKAAETFDAETTSISMGKKLIDTRHVAWRKLAGIRTKIVDAWRSGSLPYPENGVRLIKREHLDEFTEKMNALVAELRIAEKELDEQYADIRKNAEERLGDLYDASDYPVTLVGLFDVSWDFPSIEPPSYLQSINPKLYEQECERIRGRFTEAVRLAENAFTTEFSKLVAHLTDRLAGDDGRPKAFRDSAVTNLKEFFDKFQEMTVGSNEELETLVDHAKNILGNHSPEELRDSETLRTEVAEKLAEVRETLDGMIVDRPRRNLIREPR